MYDRSIFSIIYLCYVTLFIRSSEEDRFKEFVEEVQSTEVKVME